MNDLLQPSDDSQQADSVPRLVRPFEEQSKLEKWIRAALYHPTDALRRAEISVVQAAKAKAYGTAASAQDTILKSRREIEMWNEFLALYEEEFHRANAALSESGGDKPMT